MTAASEDYYWGLVFEIDDQGDKLTQWEIDFIDNLLCMRPELSVAQMEKIDQIYEERVE